VAATLEDEELKAQTLELLSVRRTKYPIIDIWIGNAHNTVEYLPDGPISPKVAAPSQHALQDWTRGGITGAHPSVESLLQPMDTSSSSSPGGSDTSSTDDSGSLLPLMQHVGLDDIPLVERQDVYLVPPAAAATTDTSAFCL